tara:strand:- start:118 stop:318 length:201 start_codon:yes stop_codon:yes gene_type:complete
MLLNLINEMLIDYDGISDDTYEELLQYLRREDASEEDKKIMKAIFRNVKVANERWYITEYMELDNE